MPSQGFPPASGPAPRVLLLGTLPGTESLRRGEYYGLPRNRFWWIMGQLAGATPELPYAARLARLAAAGVALWDVCHSAERPGSLDAAIRRDSIRANDIAGFVAAHPSLRLVACNGATAEALYRRLVLPGSPALARLPLVRLPSTSPAHAGLPAAAKLAQWRAALAPVLTPVAAGETLLSCHSNPGETAMPTTVKQLLAAAEAEVPRIGAAEARALHAAGQAVFIDLREPPELTASGKVPGALAIPRGLLEFRTDPEGARDPALAAGKTVITYCASGGRAALAGKTLKELGYTDVRNLGGFKDWLAAGGAVEQV